jgi:hypothetical protein
LSELNIWDCPPSTLRNIDDGPQEVLEQKICERPPSTIRNIDGGSREVLELKIQERPPSTLRNIEGGPPGGAGAEDQGAPTINAKKRL